MKVVADRELCTGSGYCVVACEQVFAQDDDGLVVILDERPDESLRPGVEEAVANCPAACIWVEED